MELGPQFSCSNNLINCWHTKHVVCENDWPKYGARKQAQEIKTEMAKLLAAGHLRSNYSKKPLLLQKRSFEQLSRFLFFGNTFICVRILALNSWAQPEKVVKNEQNPMGKRGIIWRGTHIANEERELQRHGAVEINEHHVVLHLTVHNMQLP